MSDEEAEESENSGKIYGAKDLYEASCIGCGGGASHSSTNLQSKSYPHAQPPSETNADSDNGIPQTRKDQQLRSETFQANDAAQNCLQTSDFALARILRASIKAAHETSSKNKKAWVERRKANDDAKVNVSWDMFLVQDFIQQPSTQHNGFSEEQLASSMDQTSALIATQMAKLDGNRAFLLPIV